MRKTIQIKRMAYYYLDDSRPQSYAAFFKLRLL